MQYNLISRITSIATSQAVLYGGLILFCTYVWWANIYYLDLKIAWGGWSPIDYVHQSFEPANFAKNFPSGIHNYDRSAFMHIYKLAYAYLGVSPESLLPVIVGIEIAVTAWLFYTLSRTLFPNSSNIVPIILIVLVITSNARNMDLARWNAPLFIGLYYTVADVLRVFAIIMILK